MKDRHMSSPFSPDRRLRPDDFPLTVSHARRILLEAEIAHARIGARLDALGKIADKLPSEALLDIDRIGGAAQAVRFDLRDDRVRLAAATLPDAPYRFHRCTARFIGSADRYLLKIQSIEAALPAIR